MGTPEHQHEDHTTKHHDFEHTRDVPWEPSMEEMIHESRFNNNAGGCELRVGLADFAAGPLQPSFNVAWHRAAPRRMGLLDFQAHVQH